MHTCAACVPPFGRMKLIVPQVVIVPPQSAPDTQKRVHFLAPPESVRHTPLPQSADVTQVPPKARSPGLSGPQVMSTRLYDELLEPWQMSEPVQSVSRLHLRAQYPSTALVEPIEMVSSVQPYPTPMAVVQSLSPVVASAHAAEQWERMPSQSPLAHPVDEVHATYVEPVPVAA